MGQLNGTINKVHILKNTIFSYQESLHVEVYIGVALSVSSLGPCPDTFIEEITPSSASQKDTSSNTLNHATWPSQLEFLYTVFTSSFEHLLLEVALFQLLS